MPTFRHLIANSTFIMPSGKTLVFAGAKGGAGIYTTEDKDEIAELRKIAVVPSVQLEELKETASAEAGGKVVVVDTPTKAADPAIAAAVADAAASAEKAADPVLTAATADLGKLLAAAKTK